MGGLVSDIGTLFGGSGAKTDRKNQLQGYGDLNNLFNFGFSQGKAATGAATDLLGQAGGYYSKLLSGDRAATLSAVAPTVSTANSQTDAAKRQLSQSGTARGGGINATAQTLEDQKRSQIDQAVNSAKAGAAGGATATGGTLASEAGSLLGVGTSSATSLADIASKSRDESNTLHQQSVQAASQLTNQLLDALFGA